MTSKRVIGSVEILGNLAIGDKTAMRTFNGTAPDSNTGIVNYSMYKRTEIQKILDMLPISRVGEMDYLPLNVSGSYEGATSNSDTYRIQPCIIEDDGTGVILRAGTNGSTSGFYYAFIRDLRNIENILQEDVITTTSKYKPSILPQGQDVKSFIGTNGYELLVCLTTANNYIFTLTNGTFNEVSHLHAPVSASVFGTDKPLYAHTVGTKIYIWCKDTTISNNGLALSLYTVDVSSVKVGSMGTLTKITGFSGQTVRSTSYSAAKNIRVYDRLYSVGASTDSLFECNSPVNRIEYIDYNDYNIQANISDDLSKVRVTMYPTHRAVTSLYTSSVYSSGFSFVYNINSKSMTLDGSARAPIQANYVNNAFVLNNPFAIDMINFTGTSQSQTQLGNCGSICQTYDGLVFTTKSRWISSETYGVQIYNVSGNPYDSWVASTRKSQNSKFINVSPTYGSAIGENLLGVRFIDKRKVLLTCSGTYQNKSYGYNNTVFSEIGSDPTYTYNSVVNSQLKGFAPEVNRKLLGDVYDYSAMISLIDTDGSVKAFGSSFIEGINKQSRGLLNPDSLTFTGTYTISDGVLSNLKNEIITKSGLSGLTTGKIVLYYVPDSSFSKSIAVLCTYNQSTNVGYAIYSEVDLVVTGTNINSGTVYSTRYETIGSVSNVDSAAYMKRCTGLTIAKYNGFTYMGVDAINQFSQPGGYSIRIMLSKIKNGVISESKYYSSSYIDSGLTYQHGVIPGLGFGYYSLNDSDYQTKAVFSLFGSTESDFDAMFSSGSSAVKEKIVIVSQDVAEGFAVYFTREVPVFLGGIYDKLPVQSVDLKSIKSNPANSTFYIYIDMNRSTKKASYNISTIMLDESLTRTYIGAIVTGATNITSIDTEKVTRFLTYRTSTTKRGSAIPSSTGVPSAPSTRWK